MAAKVSLVNPSSFDLHIGYTCPNCDTENFVFLETAKTDDSIKCHSCSNTFVINKIKTVLFEPTLVVEDTKQFVKGLTKLDIAKVFQVMQSNGFTKKDCETSVVKAVTMKPKSLKELIRMSIVCAGE